MKQTEHYSLNKPEANDYANIQALNDNADAVDTALKGLEDGKLDTSGDGSGATVKFTEVSVNANLTSGEKLSVAFGKIAKAVSSLIAHLADNVKHITAAERAAWDGKQAALTFDSAPTQGSGNPVTSGGISAALSNKANGLIGETGQPLDKTRAFGFYRITNPTSGFPPGYTSDSHFALYVTGEDPNWSPWLLFDLRTGATFRGGYTTAQFRAWEPLATAADLAGKANVDPTAIDGTIDPFTLQNGQYVYEGIVPTNKNYPPELVGGYYHMVICVTGRVFYGDNGYGEIKIMLGDGAWYANSMAFDRWTGWRKIATATPPQEYDLPLAAGVTGVTIPKYNKNGIGYVDMGGTITFATGPTASQVIATLPAGYRPAREKTILLQSSTGAAMYGWVLPDGNVRLVNAAPPSGFGAQAVIAIICPPFYAAY